MRTPFMRAPLMRPALAMALEPRYMFDGAAAVTAAQVAVDNAAHADVAQPATDALAAALAQFAAAVPAVSTSTDFAAKTGPAEVRAADPAQNGGRKEVVFVDSATPDYQKLVDGVKAGIEVEVIDSAQDGLSQIAQWAQTHQGYDAIHIMAHGAEASLRLGSATITESTLSTSVGQVETTIIGGALTDTGDLLIYGCDVAKGTDGQRFVTALASATGADVAASDARVGTTRLDGGWELTTRIGSIEAGSALTAAAMEGYDHVLAPAHAAPDAAVLADAIAGVPAPLQLSSADPSLTGGTRDVVFIDASVPDYTVLTASMRPGTEIQLIDSAVSGFAQVAVWAQTHSGYDSIHILSHGSEGRFYLGSDMINDAGLSSPTLQAELAAVGTALNAGGDLLLYGCDIAKGDNGLRFLQDLSAATGADVAASTDQTGSSSLGGNWTLELSSGWIDASSTRLFVDIPAYDGLLATAPSALTAFDFTKTTGLGGGDGSTVIVARNVLSSGWDVTSTFASATQTTNLVRGTNNGGMGSAPNYSGSLQIGAASTDKVVSVAFTANDGSAFDGKELYIESTEAEVTATITGYKNNSAVTGATISATLPKVAVTSRSFTLLNMDSKDAFNNVDKIIVTFSSAQSRFMFDNLKVGPAITAATNSAPVLTDTSPSFTAQSQSDTGTPSGAVGTLVSQLVNTSGVTNFTDADSNSPGMAITAADTSGGTWYYSTNGGTSWSAVGTVSASSALLLKADANTRLYLKSNGTYTGTLSSAITFRAWDGTTGTAGSTADTSTNGGSTAFSSATDTASMTVNSANHAPLLDSTKSPALSAQNKTDQSIPTGAVGTLVSQIIGTTGIANYSDSDGDTAGIALTGTDTSTASGSSWYYTTDGGTSWNSVGSVSDSSALLLKADANTRLYFVNNGTYTGTISSALTFRAWDGTTGTAGSKLSAAATGGGTAYSSASDTASLIINAVNTAPTFTSATTTLTVAANSSNNSYSSLVTVSDTDTGQVETWSVITGPNHGTLALTGNPATAASGSGSIVASSRLTYTSSTGYAGTDSFTIQVSDGTATITKTITVTITPAAPGTPDLVAASDSGNSSTDNLTNATTLKFSGTGAAYGSGSSDGSDVVVFISNSSSLTGDGATALGSNKYTIVSANTSGVWDGSSGAGIDVSTLGSGTYYVYAYTRSLIGSVTGNLSSALTVTIDRTAPTLSSSTPAVNATAVATSSTIQTTFNETVQKGAGNVVLYNVTTGTTVETFDAATSTSITGWGTSTLTVTPTAGNMVGGNVYSLRIASTAVVDNAGNAYAGISNDTVIKFTTANTAPTFTGAGTATLTVNKNESTAINLSSYLTASDIDPNQTLTWTISTAPSNSGTLTVTGATASSGSASISPGGTVTYKPATGFTGTETFTIQVSDGTSTATRSFSITVNAPPTAGASGGSASYTEQAAAAAVDSGFTVTDSEGNWTGGTLAVAITAGSHSGDTLALPASGSGYMVDTSNGKVYRNGTSGTQIGTASVNSGSVTGSTTLTITFIAGATTADVQALARAVTFANSNTDPSSGNRTVTFTVTDAGNGTTGLSSTATRTVAFALKNDAPTLSATAATTPAFAEGAGTGTTLFTAATASTVESAQTFSALVLTVGGLQNGANEKLVIDGQNVTLTNGTTVASTTVNGYGVSVSVTGSTATVTITKTGVSASSLQSLITGLQYLNDASAVIAGNRTVTVTSVQDSGGTSNGGTDTATVTLASTVSVTAPNHVPTLTGLVVATSTPAAFTEGGSAVAVFSGADVGIGANDSGQSIKTVVFTVGNLADGASEILVIDGSDVALTNGNSVTTATNSYVVAVAVTGSTATVTVTKASDYSATAAAALINGVSYKNTSDNPTVAGGRTVALTSVQDTGGTAGTGVDTLTLSSGNSSSVSVSAVNDAPTLTVPGTTTAYGNTTSGASYVSISGISAADVDVGSGNVTVTLSADQSGKIKLGTTTGVTFDSGANDSASMTISGTLANVNAALATLTFKTGRTASGNETITLNVSDNGNSGSGGTLSSGNKTITVSYTKNDAPAVTVASAQTYTTTGAHSITGVSVTDTLSNSTVTATVSVTDTTYGSVTLTASGSAQVTGTGTSRSISGSVADVSATLATLSYTSTRTTSGSDTITVVFDDAYQTGASANETVTKTIAVTITANSAGTIAVPGGQTVATSSSSNSITGVAITDSDVGTTVTATVSVTDTTNGSVSLTASGSASLGGTATARTITGTLADVNATLATLTYTTTSSTTTTDTITVTFSDGASSLIGGAQSAAQQTIAVTITTPAPNNQPYGVVIRNSSLTFTEGNTTVTNAGAGGNVLYSNAQFTVGIDADDHIDEGQTIRAIGLTIGGLADGASEILVVDGTDVALTNGNAVTTATSGYTVSVSLSGSTATVTITRSGDFVGSSTSSNDTITSAATLVRGLNYKNTSENPTTGNRTVTMAYVKDSGGTANSGDDTYDMTGYGAVTITVAAVNDAPTLTVPTAALNAYNTSTYYAVSGVSAADPDVGGATMSVTLTADQHGKIKLGTTTGLTLDSGSNDSSSVTYTGTLTNINAALATLTFQTGRTTSGDETITITINDQNHTVNSDDSGSGGDKTDIKTVTVTYTANDTPSVTVPGTQTLTLANNTAITGVSVSDSLAGSSVTATVSVTDTAHATLSLTASGSANVSNNNSATVTITGSLGDVNLTLATLKYSTTATATAASADTITVSVDDNWDPDSDGTTLDGKTGSNTITIDLTANSAGTITAPTAYGITLQGANAITGVSVADSDVGATVTATVSVTDTTNGSVSFTASGSAILGGTATARTITGTLADVNATLATLKYTTIRTDSGGDTITVAFDDNATTRIGGAKTATSQDITVSITANAAPSLTMASPLPVADDTATTVDASTSLSDMDGAGTAKVTISASHGTLNLSATGLTLASGSLNSGSLSYTGSLNDIRTALQSLQYTATQYYHGSDTITVTVEDQQTTLIGGSQTGTANIAVVVTHTDIQPDVTVTGGLVNVYDTTARSLATSITVADADVSSTVMTVTITATDSNQTSNDNGNLTISTAGGATVTSGNGSSNLIFTGTLTQINAALATLTYTATAANAADVVTISVSDDNATFAGGAKTGTATVTINAATVAAPDLTVPTPSVGGVNDTLAHAVTGVAIETAGVDYDSVVSVTVSVGANANVTASGVLGISTSSGVTITSGANDTSSITFSGTLAEVNAALASLTYTAKTGPITGGGPTTETITVVTSFTNAVGGAQTTTKTIDQNLSENAAPTVNVPGTAPSYTDTTQHAVSGFSITDTTVGSTVTATVSATKGNINITAGGATVTTNDTGSVTISGSLADVNTALGTLKYTSTAAATGTDTITLLVSDGGTSYIAGAKTGSNTLTVTLTQNDTPVLTLPVATPSFSDTNSNTVSDGYPGTDTGNHVISVADTSSTTYTVTLSDLHGKLKVTATDGDSDNGTNVTITGNDSIEVTISGTRGDVNATLATLKYQTDVAATGTETINVTVSDGDTTAIGGAKTAQGSFDVALVGNDTPEVTAPADNIVVGDNHARTVAGFSFTDTRSGAAITATVSSASGLLHLTAATGATVTDNDTKTVTVTGTAAAVNATLASFTYQSETSILADIIQVSVNDGNTAAIGGAKTGLGQITVTAAPNDAAVMSTPSDQTYFYTANNIVPVFTFTDTYYGENYTATITVNHGMVHLSAAGSAAIATNDAASVSVTGSFDDVIATLATMTYTTTLTTTADDTLTVSIDDNNTEGLGGNQISNRSITLSMIQNDTPSLASPGGRTFDHTQGNAIPGFEVSDTLNDGNITAVVRDTSGLLSFSSDRGASVSGNGSSAVTISGTRTAVNATLATLSYTATLLTSGTDTITVSINDGGTARVGGAKDTETSIEVTLIGNDTPSLAVPSSQTFVRTAGNAVPGFVITDALNDGTVTAAASGRNGTLSFSAVGDASISGNGSGLVTITGSRTAVNATLATLTYATTLTDSGTDTITVSVRDNSPGRIGGEKTVTGSATLTLIGNDTPSLAAPSSQTFTQAAGNAVTGFAITDALNDGTVTAAASGRNGTLSFSAVGDASISGNGSGLVTITGSRTAVNATLATLTYATTLTDSGTDTITVSVRDNSPGRIGGEKTVTGSATLTLTGNDTPVLTTPADRTIANASGNAISGFAIADTLNTGAVSATARSTNGILSFSAAGAAIIGGNGTGSVTIRGTLAEVNATLATLTYATTLTSSGTDTITVTADDGGTTLVGGAKSMTGSVALTLTSYEAASLSLGGAITATTGVATPVTGITLSGDTRGEAATVILSARSGTLSVGGRSGATITLTGSLADLNALLAGLQYTTTLLGAGGSDVIAVAVQTGRADAVGGIRTANGSIAVTGASPAVIVNTPTVIQPGTPSGTAGSASVLLTTPTTTSAASTGATSTSASASVTGSRSDTALMESSSTSVGGVDTGAHNSNGLRSISFGNAPADTATAANTAGNQVLTTSNMGGVSSSVSGTATTANPAGNQVLAIRNIGGASSSGMTLGTATGLGTTFSLAGGGNGGITATARGFQFVPATTNAPGNAAARTNATTAPTGQAGNAGTAGSPAAGTGNGTPATIARPQGGGETAPPATRNTPAPASGQNQPPPAAPAPEPPANGAGNGNGANPGDQTFLLDGEAFGFMQQVAFATGEFERSRIDIERDFESFAALYQSAA